MAIAKLEFNLDDADDFILFNRVNKSTNMAIAIWEILHNTRKKIEWEIEHSNLDAYETLDNVYSKIWEIVSEDNDIDIDKLIN